MPITIEPGKHESPSWISSLTMGFISKPIQYARKHNAVVDPSIIPSIDPAENSMVHFERLKHSLEEQARKKKQQEQDGTLKPSSDVVPISILSAVIHSKRRLLLGSSILAVLGALLLLTAPPLLSELLEWSYMPAVLRDADKNKAILIAVAMGLSTLVYSFLNQNATRLATRASIDSSVAITAMLYQKILVFGDSIRQRVSGGSFINLLFGDSARIQMFLSVGTQLMSVPVILVIGFAELVWKLGWGPFISALLMICILMPLNAVAARILFGNVTKSIAAADIRLSRVNECLTGIKVIKAFALEPTFEARITASRAVETRFIYGMSVASSVLSTVMDSLSPMLYLACFSAYVLRGSTLRPDVLFTTMSVIGTLRRPLGVLPILISSMFEAKLSSRRISAFLSLPEFHRFKSGSTAEEDVIIHCSDASFSWIPEDDGSDLLAVLATKKKKPSLEGPPKKVKKAKKKPAARSSDSEPSSSSSLLFDLPEDTTSEHMATISEMADVREEPEPESTSVDINPQQADPDVLRDISLTVRRGEHICIAGRVGSSKSSLLVGLLGELSSRGTVQPIKGRVAYVAQSSWIMNATLRDNVLNGLPYDAERYARVLEACCMLPDLAQLPGGDQAELGSKGLNISGGQQARVALSRAVYSDADVYLLDDPLSAVDTHISRRLFEDVIQGLLADKTVLLATHQVQYLPRMPRCILLEQGRVQYDGEPGPAIKLGLITSPTSSPSAEASEGHEDDAAGAGAPGSAVAATVLHEEDKGQLLGEERREEGRTGFRMLLKYLTLGGGWTKTVSLLFVAAIAQTVQTSVDLYLSDWAEGSPWFDVSDKRKLLIQLVMTLAMAGLIFLRGIWVSKSTYSVSVNLHEKVTTSVLGAPLTFFETTALGTILNRFASDFQSTDTQIARYLMPGLALFTLVISQFIIICFTNMYLILVCIVAIFLYIVVFTRFRNALAALKRLEAVSRSPLLSFCQESLDGLISIRAYDKQQEFTTRNIKDLDRFAAFAWPLRTLQCWMGIRLEAVTAGVTLACALVMVFYPDNALAGLSLNYCSTLAATISFVLTSIANLFTELSCTERLIEYSTLPQEASRASSEGTIPEGWPSAGKLTVQDLRLKYRPELEPALNGVSFTVRPGEKVGIVGRSGAGKSSTAVSLLRLTEPTGTLLLDGVDLLKAGLHDVRGAIALIPQAPFLFEGTIKDNLDPAACTLRMAREGDMSRETAQRLIASVGDQEPISDGMMWESLAQVQMADYFHQRRGLESRIASNGSNLSSGQCQLLCIARALVRQCKVILMDEATASVDPESDRIIQDTVRTVFKDCTVLSIAHRLSTVMDFDRILVMGPGGIVAEMDTPRELLLKHNGVFTQMVRETGPAQEALLRGMVGL
eukprot:gnl/Dysnectes_brevis/983_a1095_3233.p1 GENE.gnl/Dysnectes_brevis/983_a1095_3233~~gnl/Dysnectes_brevis/983_a1095_3233.p1  ORF type:complete len:1384 (+),score=460.23 gnl/Dysnectes_brevis/983_a1095_3233:51-4202(+)